jgi:hypothetical protein
MLTVVPSLQTSPPSLQIGLAGMGVAFSDTPTSKWSCIQWMQWHQNLVKAFKEGRFASRIKYSDADAIRLSNQVFIEHWNRLKTLFDKKDFCGYSSDFFNYFRAVGLSDILSFVQALVNPVVSTGIKVVEGGEKVVTNVVDTVSSTTNALKWVVPVVLVVGIGGVSWWAYNNYIAPQRKALGRVRRSRKVKNRKTKKR